MALMFSKDDVDSVGPPLARLLRLIFYRNRVTLDQFSAMAGEYGKRVGYTPAMINTNRGNLRKALVRKDDITWRLFHGILLNIMRLNIEEIKIVIRTETGELVEIGSKDPVEGPPLSRRVRPQATPPGFPAAPTLPKKYSSRVLIQEDTDE